MGPKHFNSNYFFTTNFRFTARNSYVTEQAVDGPHGAAEVTEEASPHRQFSSSERIDSMTGDSMVHDLANDDAKTDDTVTLLHPSLFCFCLALLNAQLL